MRVRGREKPRGDIKILFLLLLLFTFNLLFIEFDVSRIGEKRGEGNGADVKRRGLNWIGELRTSPSLGFFWISNLIKEQGRPRVTAFVTPGAPVYREYS